MWRKVYTGPFSHDEAHRMAEGLRTETSKRSGIAAATVRRRSARGRSKCVCTSACGAGMGHNEVYDVYVKSL